MESIAFSFSESSTGRRGEKGGGGGDGGVLFSFDPANKILNTLVINLLYSLTIINIEIK